MKSALRYLGLARPHHDELLSSAIARASVGLAEWSPKGVNGIVYTKRTLVVSPDLQGGVSLAREFFDEVWGLDAEDVIDRHTLVNYYTHYKNTDFRSEIAAGMLRGMDNLHTRLGICTSKVRIPKHFQMCRMCVENDLKNLGYTYLRRSHHLPGVLVCFEHHVPLAVTAVPFRPLTRHQHVLPHASMLEKAVDLEVDASRVGALVRLAKASVNLLKPEPVVLSDGFGYRKLFADRYREPRSKMMAYATQELCWLFGAKNLELMFKGEGGSRCSWLHDVLYRPGRSIHPLRHLLLESLFSEPVVNDAVSSSVGPTQPEADAVVLTSKKSWGLYKNADLRRKARGLSKKGLSLRQIAKQLKVDPGTVKKLLAPLPEEKENAEDIENLRQADRESWLDLMQKHPNLSKTQLRALAPALYTRLYRFQRGWLMVAGPTLKTEKSPRKDRLDWGKRDSLLAGQIARAANFFRAENPEVKISRSYILGRLGCKPLYEKYSEKLPLTADALVKHLETTEQFHFRRLLAVLSKQRVSPSVAFRRARINHYRYPDQGVSIYRSVLTLCLMVNAVGSRKLHYRN